MARYMQVPEWQGKNSFKEAKIKIDHVNYKLAFAIYLYKDFKSHAGTAADFQYPWKEFRVESRNEVLCALGKTGRISLKILWYFQELIWWAQFLYLLISRKSIKILHGDDCSLWVVETFCKEYVLDCMYSCFTKITYILTTFGVVSQSYLRFCLLDYSPSFYPK